MRRDIIWFTWYFNIKKIREYYILLEKWCTFNKCGEVFQWFSTPPRQYATYIFHKVCWCNYRTWPYHIFITVIVSCNFVMIYEFDGPGSSHVWYKHYATYKMRAQLDNSSTKHYQRLCKETEHSSNCLCREELCRIQTKHTQIASFMWPT